MTTPSSLSPIKRRSSSLHRTTTTTRGASSSHLNNHNHSAASSTTISHASSDDSNSKKRWNEAIHRIMLVSRGRSIDISDHDPPDAVGVFLQYALNHTPVFCGAVNPYLVTHKQHQHHNYYYHSNNPNAPTPRTLTKPVFSRHNRLVLQHWFQTVTHRLAAWWQYSYTTATTRGSKHGSSTSTSTASNTSTRWRTRVWAVQRLVLQPGTTPTLTSSILLLLRLSLLGLAVAAVVVAHVVVVQTTVWAATVLWWGCSYVVDVPYLYELVVPVRLRHFLQLFMDWMDAHAGLGLRFAGREWTKEDFEWTAATDSNCLFYNPSLVDRSNRGGEDAEEEDKKKKKKKERNSWNQKLWALPPPTLRQLGRRLSLDSDYLLTWLNQSKGNFTVITGTPSPEKQKQPNKRQWSARTAQHMTAIHYCYTMLRDDHLRRQAERQQQKQIQQQQDNSTSSVSSTGAVLVTSHPDQSSTPTGDNTLAGTTSPQRRTAGAVVLYRKGSSNVYSVMDGGEEETEVKDDDADSSNELLPHEEAIELKVASPQSVNEETPSDNNNDNNDDNNSPNNSFANNNSIDMLSDLREVSSVEDSSSASDVAADLPWIDVGHKIGMRLLNSAHVQRVMSSQETTERLMGKFVATTTAGAVLADHDDHAGGSSSHHDDSPTAPVATTTTAAAAATTRSTHSPKEKLPKQAPLLPPKPIHSLWSSPAIPTTPHQTAVRKSLLASTAVTSNNNNTETTAAAMTLPSTATTTATTTTKRRYRREPLQAGVKVAVPLFPYQPDLPVKTCPIEMGTVVSSQRIHVPKTTGSSSTATQMNNKKQHRSNDERPKQKTNALSVTVKLDRCFLRNGEFSELTFRVLDEWDDRYMPRHSKEPIGACVATRYGIGILVGWRVVDDCHVVRSLWQRRGPGAAHAYLNRHAIRGAIEAATGFQVQTRFGWGIVLTCVNDWQSIESLRYFVAIKEAGRHKGHVLELERKDIISCHGAQFIPIIEHIREAAHYQIQVDTYKAAMREAATAVDDNHHHNDEPLRLESVSDTHDSFWKSSSACLDILWSSFLKAVDEDREFDAGVNEFMSEIIQFLEKLDEPANNRAGEDGTTAEDDAGTTPETTGNNMVPTAGIEIGSDAEGQDPGFWIMDELFGGIFKPAPSTDETSIATSVGAKCGGGVEVNRASDLPDRSDHKGGETKMRTRYYSRAFGILKILMKTVSHARAASSREYPSFHLSLAVIHEFLLFLRTIIRVQQKNSSVYSLEVWKRAWVEIVTTFGPIKDRIQKIGKGIAMRMEHQGRLAKIRLLKLVDSILGDEKLLIAVEQADWTRCLSRLEAALLKSHVIEESSLGFYRKVGALLLNHFQTSLDQGSDAATRNCEKLDLFAQAVQSLASPRRSLLKLLRRDEVLDLLERILTRAYYKEELATRMLTIHTSNFQSLRQIRMLKDFSVAGRIWIPLLDAADEEFSWVVSLLPDKSKDFMAPLSSLFSLCVAQFHKIHEGDLSKDWLAFLLEEESVRIIQDIDMKLILALQAFSRDISEMLQVLPYYPSIDDDILNLMDEVDLDALLKEASEAMDDEDGFSQFLREKATIAIERFLKYLPKMSIPVEKRDLGGDMKGWALTCRGEDGGDLRLSDVHIGRKNLVCKVMGDAIYFPMFGDNADDESTGASFDTHVVPRKSPSGCVEESVLDDIREMILRAQRYGCWKVGFGGISQAPSDRYVASVLHGLPISAVLNCGIELWRNLEIDDDELLEIAIRDVSFQVQLQKDREEGIETFGTATTADSLNSYHERTPLPAISSSGSQVMGSLETTRRRFNPRVDPSVLFLEMKDLKLHLKNFSFRIEKNANRTMFDPIFEGRGMVSLQNVSIRLRVECAKEQSGKPGMGRENSTPILKLRELDVQLERVELKVKDTGFGSDWLLNRAVDVFTQNITKVVEENLREKIQEQVKVAIENLNSYFVLNPNIFLSVLGISMDDLDENVVWV